jgi:hypothetical protein
VAAALVGEMEDPFRIGAAALLGEMEDLFPIGGVLRLITLCSDSARTLWELLGIDF